MAVGRMNEVQLVDEPEGLRPDGSADRTRATRARVLRVLRRWWPLAAGVVTALVVAQVVADRQHRAEVEHRRETDGVVRTTVSAPLEATRWESPDVGNLTQTGLRTPDGLIVGIAIPAEVAAPSFVAVDPVTGTEQWRVDVGDPSPGSGFRGCTLVTEPSPTVWCLLFQAASRDGDAVVLAPHVVEIGLEERAVLDAWDLPPESGVGIAGSALVVATPGRSSTQVQATDLASGDVRWTVSLDDPLLDGGSGLGVGDAGDHVLVPGGTGTWVIDLATGGAVEVPGEVVPTRVGRIAVTEGSTSTFLLDAAGGRQDEIRGVPLPVRPDDGTAGDVLLVQRYDGTANGVLAAVDASSGEPLWERRSGWDPNGQLMLLDGVLYATGGASVWAVDAVTGDERWSTPTGPGGGTLMTDGRSVLRAERDAGTGDPVLAAYDLDDGRLAWTAPLPDEVMSVWASAGALLGWGTDGGQFTIG